MENVESGPKYLSQPVTSPYLLASHCHCQTCFSSCDKTVSKVCRVQAPEQSREECWGPHGTCRLRTRGPLGRGPSFWSHENSLQLCQKTSPESALRQIDFMACQLSCNKAVTKTKSTQVGVTGDTQGCYRGDSGTGPSRSRAAARALVGRGPQGTLPLWSQLPVGSLALLQPAGLHWAEMQTGNGKCPQGRKRRNDCKLKNRVNQVVWSVSPRFTPALAP